MRVNTVCEATLIKAGALTALARAKGDHVARPPLLARYVKLSIPGLQYLWLMSGAAEQRRIVKLLCVEHPSSNCPTHKGFRRFQTLK